MRSRWKRCPNSKCPNHGIDLLTSEVSCDFCGSTLKELSTLELGTLRKIIFGFPKCSDELDDEKALLEGKIEVCTFWMNSAKTAEQREFFRYWIAQWKRRLYEISDRSIGR